MANKVIFLTQGTTSWTVPADWNSQNNTIECIGAGAGAGNGAGGNSGNGGAGGGGGGAYSKISNLSLTSNSSVTVSIGSGGGHTTNGGDTYFNGASLVASSVGAKGGTASVDPGSSSGG